MIGFTISRWLNIRKTTCLAVCWTKLRIKKVCIKLLKKMDSHEVPNSVREALQTIALQKGFSNYTLKTKLISSVGENSYGLVLQTKIASENESKNPFFCVVKIAPNNSARRRHMKVVDCYKREVFMYEHVLKAFKRIQEKEKIPRELAFDAVPNIYFSSLNEPEEFIIFEDLAERGYFQNCRQNLPTFSLSMSALRALAKYHAMSFILQAKQPKVFESLINQIRYKDNLFTPNMDPISMEFAKKYIRLTLSMLAGDKQRKDQAELMLVTQIFEKEFKKIALNAVDGNKCAPYAVICHGDFWNNNILYRYDDFTKPTMAKLIDFQMSRYASPVLDIVNYFFACTDKDLRDSHFTELIQIYHDALTEHLCLFNLNPDKIFPKTILDIHLKKYGSYGFCMAIFGLPFFISDSVDLPDLDEVSEAINDISPIKFKNLSDEANNNVTEGVNKSKGIVDEYEMLTEKTIPIFKRRIIGVLMDLYKYDMVQEVLKFNKE